MCQRKLLTAMTLMEDDPEISRAFHPTRLEWTANHRKGKMLLDIYTYEGNSWCSLSIQLAPQKGTVGTKFKKQK